jgi:hypothetical protein
MKNLLLPIAVSIVMGLPTITLAQEPQANQSEQQNKLKLDYREFKQLPAASQDYEAHQSEQQNNFRHDHREFKQLPPAIQLPGMGADISPVKKKKVKKQNKKRNHNHNH